MHDQRDAPVIAQQVAILSESADALVRRGQLDDAAKVYERINQVAPYNLKALDFLATRAFERGDTDLCLQLLERARQANPERPRTYLNLGAVYKVRREYAEALRALDKGLQLKPVFPYALLNKGMVLEEMGREQEALGAYYQAFKCAPGMRREEAQMPDKMRALALHGDQAVKQASRKLLDTALDPLRAGHDAHELQRIEELADLYVGRRSPQYRHVAQQPSFLYFPGLEPRPFFERDEFDWCKALESHTAEIRAELLAVLQAPDGLKPYVDIPADDAGLWTGLNKSLQWSSFHLYKAGARVEDNCRRCPATAAAVEQLPLPRTPGHSPEIFFSILKPGTHIPPHFGLGNYKLAVHLPLIVPADCSIRVGNETRGWEEGRCLIFDDSFKHEAWNNSGEQRAVLILDAWNPQLSELERAALGAVLGVTQQLEDLYGGNA